MADSVYYYILLYLKVVDLSTIVRYNQITKEVLAMPLIRSIWLNMKDILRLAQHNINEELKPLNLSSSEGDILFLLLTGNNNIQQEQLAERLDIGKAAISRGVASLETKGYIKRIRHPHDKRAYNVSLTDKALAIGSKIEAAYNQLYAWARAGISDDNLVFLESILTQISTNIKISTEK